MASARSGLASARRTVNVVSGLSQLLLLPAVLLEPKGGADLRLASRPEEDHGPEVVD